MARYIDADEAKSVIKANDWSNPCVPTVVNMIIDRIPTADVAPRSEVAKEIFEEIGKFVCTNAEDWQVFEELKKKYTEKGGNND